MCCSLIILSNYKKKMIIRNKFTVMTCTVLVCKLVFISNILVERCNIRVVVNNFYMSQVEGSY